MDTLDKDAEAAGGAGLKARLMRDTLKSKLFGGESAEVKIGKFTVVEKLGEGGMGVVFKVRDPELDRELAVKLLRRAPTNSGTEGHARLLREAQALAKLSHPNIIPVFEVGTHEGSVFLAMEYVRGPTLKKWLESEKRPWRDIVDKYTEAGQGLAAAHDAGLIHRDFKPENVLVGDDGRVRVVDFGLAKPHTEQDTHRFEAVPLDAAESGERSMLESPVTRAGVVVGTPAYMSPEQHSGEAIDARADQFSFCVALHEALYGFRPFFGRNMKELAHSILSGEILPERREAGVPSPIHAALRRGLSCKPGERFANMQELLAALHLEPSRAKPRIVGVAAAITLLVGTGYGAMLVTDEGPACETTEAQLAGVWDDERKQAIEARFTQFAPKALTFDEFSDSVDEWVSEWSSARQSACAAVDETEGQTQLDARTKVACLDAGYTFLATLSDTLVDAEGEVFASTAHARARLPRVGRCDNPNTTVVPLPEDAAERRRILELFGRYAEAEKISEEGDWKTSYPLFAALEEEADATGFAPLRVAVMASHGQNARVFGDLDIAEEKLVAASALAEHEGLDHDAIHIAGALTVLCANLHRGDEALVWAQGMEARAERLGLEGIQLGVVLNSMAIALQATGDLQGAAAVHERAIAMFEVLDPRPDEALGHHHHNVAGTYAQLGRFDKAAEHFDAARLLWEPILGPEHADVGDCWLGLAMVAQDNGDMEASLPHARRAIRIYEAAYGDKLHFELAKAHHVLAEGLAELGQTEDARRSAEMAVDTFRRTLGEDSLEFGMAELTIVGLEVEAGELDAARVRAQRVLTTLLHAKDLETYGEYRSRLYLAEIALQMGQPEDALDHCVRAIEQLEKHEQNGTDVAIMRFTYAKALLATKDREHAIEQARAAATVFESGKASELADVQAWLAEHAD